MRKSVSFLAVLTVLAMMLGMFGTTALAAPEALTLNIADGAIVITATGYSIAGAPETAYTGSYIITGSANTTGPFNTLTVNGVADGATVTLKDLSIITNGPPAITLLAPVQATGTLYVAASGSAITGSNMTITGDADISSVMTGGAPVFSGNINVSCRSMNMDAGMICSGGTMNLTTTGDVKFKSKNPCVSCGDLTIKAGGNVEMEAPNSLCFTVTKASVEAAGNITLSNPTSVSPAAYASNSLSLKAGGNITVNGGGSNGLLAPDKLTVSAGGNLTVSTSGNSPTISSDNVDLTASGDISVTGSKSIAVNALVAGSISAGGKLTLQGGASAPVYSGNSAGAHTLQAKGDVLVKGPYMGIAGGDLTVSGANVTVEVSGSGPAISAMGSLKLTATGDVALSTGYIAVSAGKAAEITAEGSVAITATGDAPTVTTSEGFTLKAKKAVTIENTYALAVMGKNTIEGSSVTINTGKGSPMFIGETSLKATAGNLNITAQEDACVVFDTDKVELYASEEINIIAASGRVSRVVPGMTFGKHVSMGNDSESLFVGLDRVAVESSLDLLPQLKVKINGEVMEDAVFTAALNGADQEQILEDGIYNCKATLTSDEVSGVMEIPFNLIVREAKPVVTPPTGDETPVALLAALAIVSLLGMGVVLSRKKNAA